MGGPPSSVNFGFLVQRDHLLVSLCGLAERYFAEDPVTTLMKARQFAELLVQRTAAHLGRPLVPQEQQTDLSYRLRSVRALTPIVYEVFSSIRRVGNVAVHEHGSSDRESLHCLGLARGLGTWFHRSFGNAPRFTVVPFIHPEDPACATTKLHVELARLLEHLDQSRLTAEARAQSPVQQASVTQQLQRADEALHLDEADTRTIIDEQFGDLGWEAYALSLRYSEGARSVTGRNRAYADRDQGGYAQIDKVFEAMFEEVAKDLEEQV
jgi:type I restriction enzyme R subunit